ncbi:MAG: helix-turn-helix domain-containing protein [Propioniciclava sp.]
MHLDIGRELRKVRESKKLSLRSVASAVGVSPSLLSQVETGKTQPSVGTLYALVNHLGLSLDALLHGGDSAGAPAVPAEVATTVAPGGSAYDEALRRNVIQRAADNPIIEMQNGVTWERMAVAAFTQVDPLIVTYQAGGSSGVDGRMMRHGGIEFGCILEGELTLRLDFDTFVLHTGDSFCFQSTRPHLYQNTTDTAAKGVWFVIGRRDPHLQETPGEPGGEVHINSAIDVMEMMETLRPGGTS